MLGHYEFRKTTYVIAGGILARLQIVFRTMYEAYNISILLYRSGFTKVGQLRTLAIGSVLHLTVELRKCHYRDIEFLGQLDRKSVV